MYKTSCLSVSLLVVAFMIMGSNNASAHDGATDTSVTDPWYADIASLQTRMAHGDLTATQLTRTFQKRIKQRDQADGGVNAVIETNPDALAMARTFDADTDARDGALAGIPVLIKDNIETGDKMLTTAGSLAMTGAPAARDATVVAKLRDAGAIILGKTNLSEWANYRSTHPTSGWSGRGGLTHNPYVLDRTACGSSSGSAAAVAAGFSTVAIGTETNGSVTCPAAATGIVGLKPTVGLISRAGVVPISHTQDTPGPMGRSVSDVARLLNVMAGSDPRDDATALADKHTVDYTKHLDADALQGKRIGVVRALAGDNPNVKALLEKTINTLRQAGATVVDDVELPHLGDYGKAEGTLLKYEFKHDINAYLTTRKGLSVHSLQDLIDWNKAHADKEMPWFGQELFKASANAGSLQDAQYTDALDKAQRLSGPEGIDAALRKHDLDALLAPTQGPAWRNDLIDGDNSGASAYGPAAIAGYPSITVPAGFVHHLPVGMLFFAGKWSEPKLIGMAYAYEQATQAWRPPQFMPTLPAH